MATLYFYISTLVSVILKIPFPPKTIRSFLDLLHLIGHVMQVSIFIVTCPVNIRTWICFNLAREVELLTYSRVNGPILWR